MEGQFKVIGQGVYTETPWTNRNGETKVIRSVEVELTDGIDGFVGEANDALATDLNQSPLVLGSWVRAQCTLMAVEGKAQDGRPARKFNRVRINRLVRL